MSEQIQVGDRPHLLAVAPGGSDIYVTHLELLRVTVIDTEENLVAIHRNIPIGFRAWDVAVAPDRRHIYVTHRDVDDVSVIDTTTKAVVATIPLGSANVLRRLALTPDGRHIYATHMLATAVIDTATNAVVATIPRGGPSVAVTPDGGHVYIPHMGTLSVVDTTSHAVVGTIPVPDADDGQTDQIAVAPNGRHIYVTRKHTSGSLSVIDTATHAVITMVEFSQETSYLAVAPDGRHVFVGTQDDVTVIQIPTYGRATSIPVAGPLGIAVVGQNLYLADHQPPRRTVSVISIDRLPRPLVDRTARSGYTPPAAGAPTACVIPGLGVHNIAYRDTSGRLHELWRDAQGRTGTTNLTANAGATTAQGNPYAYVDTSRNTEILLFRGGDGTVRSLYWSTGQARHDNLSGTAGAPAAAAAGDPVGYYAAAADTHHVIYRTSNDHLHVLWWIGIAPVAYGGDFTALASAPPAAGQPSAFVNGSGDNFVIYRADGNNHIFSLYWSTGAPAHEDLSRFAGTPPATGEPFAYYTAHNNTHQIVYLGNDGHLWELYWPGVAPVVGWDLTAPSGAPAAASAPVAYYSAGTNTKHVMYRSSDDRLHEIWWAPGGGTPEHVDLTASYGAPPAADRPAAFTVEGPNTQHVTYRGTDNHIYEVRW